ncbi:MAG: type II secretion system protein [Verrucomicrobiia bacterium]|jgi:prepilin-type N-terminal cleavage/methylation domain-containing protein/prepilin-type processing-associated H-X9-DG protein
MRAIFNQGNRGKLARGFTLIELLVVIAIIGILTAIYLPVVARAKAKAKQSNCASNLQQIGLSFRVFAQDSGGRFPMNVRARYGGTMEYTGRGGAYRHFMAMSNLIDSPKILLCPSDRTRSLTNWANLGDPNISYLVGVDARPDHSFHILAADRNMTNQTQSAGPVMPVTTNSVIRWTRELHELDGNILFADGRVEHADNIRLQKIINQHRHTD